MLMRRPQIASWQGTLAIFLVLGGFLVRQQEDALNALQAEIADLRAKMGEYESAAAQGRSSAETLAREVDSYRMVLGLTPVEGPGVIVRVSDRPLPGALGAPSVPAGGLAGRVDELG